MSYAIQYAAPDDPDWSGLVVVDDETEFAAERKRLEASGYVVENVVWLPGAAAQPDAAGAG